MEPKSAPLNMRMSEEEVKAFKKERDFFITPKPQNPSSFN
jgi:hypothetical protein